MFFIIRRQRKILSLLTAIFFFSTQCGILPVRAGEIFPLEVPIVSPELQMSLPPDLGTVQTIVTGTGPTLVHLQTAHGNYPAQKKIQAILHYLKDHYGFKTLLLEGSPFELEPEMIRFFPDDPQLTRDVADGLARKALLKGAELFLIEEKGVKAFGIEDLDAYKRNVENFRAVLLQKKQAEKFLADMEMQIDRLASPYLNKNLKEFLRRLDGFESGRIPLQDWMLSLWQKASQVLELDLRNPAMQIDRPMLLRYFTLRDIETRLDLQIYQTEKEGFLKAIRHLPAESFGEIKKFLDLPLDENQLPDPQTGLLFERMIALLPSDFNYRVYPNVALFIGHLILQSELKGERLFKEMDALQDKICTTLAVTDEEKQLLALFKDYRLLKKIFAIELVPEDYKTLLERTDALRPGTMIRRFLDVNRSGRVREAEFEHDVRLGRLFETALQFYAGTQERDLKMMEKIEAELKATGTDKAVIITGGFHAQPFKEHFQERGFNYALIAPKITNTEGKEAYVDYMLQSALPAATLESIFQALSYRKIQDAGFDPMRFTAAFVAETAKVRKWPSTRELVLRLNETRQLAQFQPDFGAMNLRLTHDRHGAGRLRMFFDKQAPGREKSETARSEMRVNGGFSYQAGLSSYEIPKREFGDLLAFLKSANLLAPDAAFDFNTFLAFAQGLFDQKPIGEKISADLESKIGRDGETLAAYFVRVPEEERTLFHISGLNFIFDRKSGGLQGVQVFPTAESAGPRYLDISKLRADREKKNVRQEPVAADIYLARFIRGLYAGENSVFLTEKTYRVGDGEWQVLDTEHAAAARELFKNHPGLHILKVDPGLSKSGLERAMEIAIKTGSAENDQFRVRSRVEVLATMDPKGPAGEIAESLRAQGALKNGQLRILEVGPAVVEIRSQYQVIIAKSALKDLEPLADAYASDLRAKLAILLEGRSSENPKFADLYPLRDFPLGGGTKGHIRVVYYLEQAEDRVYVLAVSEKRSENELKDHTELRDLAVKIKHASGRGSLFLDGRFLGQIATAENDQVTAFLKDRIGLVLSEPISPRSTAEELPGASVAGPDSDFLGSITDALTQQGVSKEKAEEAALGIEDLWQTFGRIAQNVGQSPAALGTTLIQLLSGTQTQSETPNVTAGAGKIPELAQPKAAPARSARPEAKKKNYSFVPGSGFLPREYQQWLNGEVSNPPEFALRVSMAQLEEPAYELLEQSSGGESRRIAMTLSGLKFFGHDELYLTPFYDSDTNSYGFQVYSPKNRVGGDELMMQGYEMTRPAAAVEDQENLIRVVMLRKQGKFSERAEELAPGAMTARSDEDETEAPGLGKKRGLRKGDLPEMKGDYFEKIAALVFHAVSGGESIYHASLSRDPLMTGYSHPDFIWQRMIFDAKLGADIDDIGQTIVKYTLVRDAHPELFDPDKPITLVVLNKTATEKFERNGYVNGRDFRFVTLEDFMAENGFAPDAKIDGFTQVEVLARLQRLRENDYSERELELEIENLGHRIKTAKVPQGKAMTKANRRVDLARLVNSDPDKLLQYLRASSQRVAGHFQKARYINKHYENLAQSLAVIQSAMPARERIERELKAHEKVYEDIQAELSRMAGLLKRILPQNLYALGSKDSRKSRTKSLPSQFTETGIPTPITPPVFETPTTMEELPQETALKQETVAGSRVLDTNAVVDGPADLVQIMNVESSARGEVEPNSVNSQTLSVPVPAVSGGELQREATEPEILASPELEGASLFDRHLADGDPGLRKLTAEMDLIYADKFPGFEKLNPLLFDPASRTAGLYAEVLQPQPLPWWDVDASEKRALEFLSRDFSELDPAEALMDFLKSSPNPNLEGEVLLFVFGLENLELQIQKPMREILESAADSESAIAKRIRAEIVDTIPKRVYYFLISLSHRAIARYSSNPRVREVGETSSAAYNRTFAFQSAFGHREWDFVSDPVYFWEAFTAYFILGRREAAKAVLQYLKIKVRDSENAGQSKNTEFLILINRMEGLLNEKIENSALSEAQAKELIRRLKEMVGAQKKAIEIFVGDLRVFKNDLKHYVTQERSLKSLVEEYLRGVDFNETEVNQLLEALFGQDAWVGRTKTHHRLLQTDFYAAVLKGMEQIPELSAGMEAVSSVLVQVESPENLMFTFPFFDDVMRRPSVKAANPQETAYASSGFATGLMRVVEQSLKSPEVHRRLLQMVSSYRSLYQEGKSMQWIVFMGAPFLEEIKQHSANGKKFELFFKNVQRSLWGGDPQEAQAASQILKVLFEAIRSPRYSSNARVKDFYRELLEDIFAGFVGHPDNRYRTVMFEFFHTVGYDEQVAIRDRARVMMARGVADSEAVGRMASALEAIARVIPLGGAREMFERDTVRPFLTPHLMAVAHEIQNLILSYEGAPEEREKIRLALERFAVMARPSAGDPALFDAAQKHVLEILDFSELSEDASLEAVLKQWEVAPFISKISEAGLKREEEKSSEDFLYALLDLSIQKKLYEDAMESNGSIKPRWNAPAARQRIEQFLFGVKTEDDPTQIAQAFRQLVKESPNPVLDFSMMDYFIQGKGLAMDAGVLEKLKEADLQNVLGDSAPEIMESSFLESVIQGVILNSTAAKDPRLKFYFEMESAGNPRVRFLNQIESLGHGEWDSITEAALFEGSFRGYLFTGKRKEALEIFHYLKIRRMQAKRRGIAFGDSFETVYDEMKKLLELTEGSPDWNQQFTAEFEIKRAMDSALDAAEKNPVAQASFLQLPEETLSSAAGTVIFWEALRLRFQKSKDNPRIQFMGDLLAFSLNLPDKAFMLFGSSENPKVKDIRGQPLYDAARIMIMSDNTTAFWDLMKRMMLASPDIYDPNNFAESFAAELAKNLKTRGSGSEVDEWILQEIQTGFWSDDALRADASFKMVEIWGMGKMLSEDSRAFLTLGYYKHFRDKPEDRPKIEATFRHYTAWYYFDYPDAFFESVLNESLQTYHAEPTIEKAMSVETDLQAFYDSETLPEYEETAEKKKDSPRKMFMKKVLGEFRPRVASDRLHAVNHAVLSDASFTDITPELDFLKAHGLENGKMTKKLQQLAKQQDDLLDRLFLDLVSQNGEGLAEADRLLAALKLEITATAGEPLPKTLDEILRHAEKYPREIPYLLRALRKIQVQLSREAKQKLKSGLTPILEQKSGHEEAVLMELKLDIQEILGDGVGLESQASALEPLVFTETDPLEFLEALGARLETLAPNARVTVWISPDLQADKEDWAAIGFAPLVDLRTELNSRMGSVDHFEIQNTDSQHFKVVLTEPIAIPGQSEPLTELWFAAATDFTHVSPRFDSLLKANSKTMKPKDLSDLQERVMKFWAEGKILLENVPDVPYGMSQTSDREQFLRFAADIQSGENPVFSKVVAEAEVDKTRKEMQSRQAQTSELIQQRLLKKIARGLAAEVEKGRQELLDQIEKRESSLVLPEKLEAGARKVLEERIRSLRAHDFAQSENSSGRDLAVLIEAARQGFQAQTAGLSAEIERLPVEKPVAPRLADVKKSPTATVAHDIMTEDIIYEPVSGPAVKNFMKAYVETPFLLSSESFAVLDRHFKELNRLIDLALSESETLKRSPQGQRLVQEKDAVLTSVREKIGQSLAKAGYEAFSAEFNMYVKSVTKMIRDSVFPQKYSASIREQLIFIAREFIQWTGEIVPREFSDTVSGAIGSEIFQIGLLEDPEGNFYGTTTEAGTFRSLSNPVLTKSFASVAILKRELEAEWRAILIPRGFTDPQKVETVMTFRRRLAASVRKVTSEPGVSGVKTLEGDIAEPLNNPILGQRILDFYLRHRLDVPEEHMRKVRGAYHNLNKEVKAVILSYFHSNYEDSYSAILSRLDQIKMQGGYFYQDVLELGQMTRRLEAIIKTMVSRNKLKESKIDRLQRAISPAVDTMNHIVYQYAFQLIQVDDHRPGRKSYMIVGFQEVSVGKIYLGIPRRPGIYVNMVDPTDEIDLNGPGPKVNAQNIFSAFPETLRPILIPTTPIDTANPNDIYLMRRPGQESESLHFESRLDPALGVELAPGVQIFETPVLGALAKALNFPDAISMRTSPLNPAQFKTFKTYLAEHARSVFDAMDQSEEGRKRLNRVIDLKVRVHFDKAGVNAVNLDTILRSSIAVGLGGLSEEDQRFFIEVLEASGLGGEIGKMLDSPALRSRVVEPRDRERFERLVAKINTAFEDFYPAMVENYERRYGSFESRISEPLGFEILPGVVVFRPEVIKAFLHLSGITKVEDLKFEPFNAETYARFLEFLEPFPEQLAAAQSEDYEGFNEIFAANILNLSQTELPPQRTDKKKLVLNAAINAFGHDDYMFFVQTLAATGNTSTENVYRLIESVDRVGESVPQNSLPRFQYIAAQVARSTRRFDKIFDVNYEKLPLQRSEVRAGLSEGSLTLEQQTRTAVETYRADLLPLRFENYGTAELVRVLEALLNRRVYSEKAGFEKPHRESILRRMMGEGQVVLTPAGANWIRNTAADGRVLLDSAWIEKLIRKSPRALYILLASLEKFQGERGIREPLLAIAGEESLLKDMAQALQRSGNGLNGEEKAEARHFLDSERLKNIVQIVPPKGVSSYIRGQNFGVATLSASQSSWLSQLSLGAQFLLEPDEVAEQDLAAVAFLVPSLLKAAQLVRGIADPAQQKAELLRHLGQILPGAFSQAGNLGFSIQLETYIQKTLLEQHLVSVSA